MAWAALLATHQGSSAQHPVLRKVFSRIAADEARHAQLAWDLHSWFLTQLSDAECKQVLGAQRQAIADLRTEKAVLDAEVSTQLGFPDAAVMTVLRAEFASGLAA